ncbi:MAG TPA: hypothetical protein VK862_20170 [Afifellaceae bacterium]|nr:hypothetical protein [Afifellaceae bacterium]
MTQNATPKTPYGLSSFELGEAQGYVGAIREYVEPGDWAEVETAFGSLSDAGQSTVLQHLAMGTTGSATPLTEGELAELMDELDIAPDLVEFWGRDRAPRMFGVLRQRFTLLREYLSADDWNRMLKLYYEGPTSAAIAISCPMAG